MYLRLLICLGLQGDSSDNIPGIPGFWAENCGHLAESNMAALKTSLPMRTILKVSKKTLLRSLESRLFFQKNWLQ